MRFSEIKGNVSEHLREEMNSSRVVHAYLFTGAKGTGKRTMLRICAQTLLCTEKDKPCGMCASCIRFENGTHPDVITLTADEGKKTISVQNVRDLIDKLSVKPYESTRHVVIVPQAEQLTTEAQNALLKTLETPPGSDVFLMATSMLRQILPTIISRSRVIRFGALNEDEAVAALQEKGIETERAKLLSRLSQGCIGKALEINQSAAWWELRDKVYKAVEQLRDVRDIAPACSILNDYKSDSGDILDMLELLARDMMVVQTTDSFSGNIIQTDKTDFISRQTTSGMELLKSVIEARKMLNSNVAWQSVLEMLLFGIIRNRQS